MKQRTNSEPLDGTTETLLIVEGADEVRVLRAFPLAPHPVIVVRSSDGQQNILSTATSASKDPNFPTVRKFGVVLDAESNVAEALRIGQEALGILGCSAPVAHAQVHVVGDHRWGLFILPDGTSEGALETLVRRTLTGKQLPAVTCAEAWEACTGPRAAVPARDKAWMRVYGASFRSPRENWLQALHKPDGIDIAAPGFDHVRAWLAKLVA